MARKKSFSMNKRSLLAIILGIAAVAIVALITIANWTVDGTTQAWFVDWVNNANAFIDTVSLNSNAIILVLAGLGLAVLAYKFLKTNKNKNMFILGLVVVGLLAAYLLFGPSIQGYLAEDYGFFDLSVTIQNTLNSQFGFYVVIAILVGLIYVVHRATHAK